MDAVRLRLVRSRGLIVCCVALAAWLTCCPIAQARPRASQEVVVGRLAAARSWFSFPASTFHARPALAGSRVVGMVIDLSASLQPQERCSGTVVNSPNGSIVWTAGHCIYLPSEFPTPFAHIEFVPGAGPGSGPFAPAAPYGVWSAVAYAMPRDWTLHGSARHWRRDFGALLIARNAQGQTLRQALGAADGISFKGISGRGVRVLGYPGSGAFTNNDSLIGCGPRPAGADARVVRGPGPAPIGIRCAMTTGSSGGPWLIHVRHNGLGTLISNTSSASNKPGYLFGPVLDRAAHSVWASLAKRAP